MKRDYSRRRRGSVILEFTLIAPVLAVMFMGTWDFGYAFFNYTRLEQAVRDGGRYASLRQFDDNHPGEFESDVACMVATGTRDCRAPSIVPGLTKDAVEVIPIRDAANKPLEVVIRVRQYQLGILIPITMQNKPQARFPYVGLHILPI